MWAKNKHAGFTIVELLIVIVVIAILAAITIVAYNGVQTRAKDGSVQSLLSTLTRKADAYRATTGQYPTAEELKYNYAPGTTVANSGPQEARLDGIILSTLSTGPGVDNSNGTKVIRYVFQDVNCAWFDWWDYNNNRISTLSTVPSSKRVGC